MRKLLILAMVLIPIRIWCATCTATGLTVADVQTALTNCETGGTVVLPAGSGIWASQISATITGPVTIEGQTSCTGGCAAGSMGAGLAFSSSGATNISTTSSGDVPSLVINGASSANMIRITGITFTSTAGNTDGSLQINCATMRQVCYRVDHISVTNDSEIFFQATEGVGLSDHILYQGSGDYSYSVFTGDYETAGYGNWENATNPIGTSNANIIEDSNFNGTNSGSTISGITDGNNGCSVVIRYNQIAGMTAGFTHGTDSGGDRSCISVEVYDNDFISTSDFSSGSASPWSSRGGLSVFFDNSLTGSYQWKSIELDYFRASVIDAVNSVTWGFANSYLNWTPQTLAGTTNTLNASSYQTSHTYAANAYVKDGSCNLYTSSGGTTGGSSPSCPSFLSNVTDSGGVVWMNVGGTTSAGPGGSGFLSTAPETPCDSGGSCTRYFDSSGGYPYRDQPGVAPGQTVYGCYQWGNTGSQIPSTWWSTDVPSVIELNRDYFNAAPSGYAPYTYPDPQQGATESGSFHSGYIGGNAVMQ